jgi:mannose-6-phosphate isomerase
VPVPDFSLTRIDVDEPTGLDAGGPCIVLVTSGAMSVDEVRVGPGHGAFVPAGYRTTVSGTGQVFVATVGT